MAIVLFLAQIALAECTIGVASGSATRDGRPIAFKTRDTDSWSLEFKVQTPSGYYAYAGNTAVSSTGVWFGQSEAGFGITQSAAYNLSSSGSGLNNSTMMNYALERCQTVDDFEAILISTNSSGRSTAANYAVFDAFGGAAIFECAPHSYARYDADSLGIAVHANFAYIGSSERVGQNRMDRAYQLMADAVAGDSLDARFIIKTVLSDLLYPGQDPYPLPWTGTFSGLPAGWINTGPFTSVQTICNANTHAAGVAQGVAIGEDPENSLLWCIFTAPVASVPFPVFPAAHASPPEGRGASSPLLVACKAKYDSLFSHTSVSYWLKAGYLLDTLGGGVLTYTTAIVDWAYDSVSLKLDEWASSAPTESQRSSFQDILADKILEAYLGGTPLQSVEPVSPVSISLVAAPNPFNSKCRLTFEPASSVNREVRVYDVTGRIVDRIAVPAQSGVAEWSPPFGAPAGLYLLGINGCEPVKIAYLK